MDSHQEPETTVPQRSSTTTAERRAHAPASRWEDLRERVIATLDRLLTT